MGIGVSLLILYAAYDVLRGASGPLLGEGLDKELERQLTEIANEHLPNASGVHHFHLHRYGDHREITLHVRLPPDTKLAAAHDIVTTVEDAIRRHLNVEATVHVEPTHEGRAATGGTGPEKRDA
jgi:divalent metal cation (Fe/Co/Zn/Cd) transporter